MPSRVLLNLRLNEISHKVAFCKMLDHTKEWECSRYCDCLPIEVSFQNLGSSTGRTNDSFLWELKKDRVYR